ncbi:hypothetical protein ACMFMG_007143 [Clarireedia jacksonii]
MPSQIIIIGIDHLFNEKNMCTRVVAYNLSYQRPSFARGSHAVIASSVVIAPLYYLLCYLSFVGLERVVGFITRFSQPTNQISLNIPFNHFNTGVIPQGMPSLSWMERSSFVYQIYICISLVAQLGFDLTVMAWLCLSLPVVLQSQY